MPPRTGHCITAEVEMQEHTLVRVMRTLHLNLLTHVHTWHESKSARAAGIPHHTSHMSHLASTGTGNARQKQQATQPRQARRGNSPAQQQHPFTACRHPQLSCVRSTAFGTVGHIEACSNLALTGRRSVHCCLHLSAAIASTGGVWTNHASICRQASMLPVQTSAH